MTVLPDSLLSGENADFLDEQYNRWVEDPDSVDPRWSELFEGLEGGPNGVPTRAPAFPTRSIFHGGPTSAAGGFTEADAARQARVVQLINAYRVRGHMKALIDPLDRRSERSHEELTLRYYGLGESDLDAVVPTAPLFGMPPVAKVREIVGHLRAVYCGSIGAEFMNIDDNDQKRWVQEQLETLPGRLVLDRDAELRVLRKLADAENFEGLIHKRFPGTKRFSLEGAETLIPLLDRLLDEAAAHGVREIVLGMPHRGRLNVLVNTLEKPARLIVREFEDVGGKAQGSGDVKYHLGYSSDVRTLRGEVVHLSLTPNPSHLEAVDPVVEGRTRAKQGRVGEGGATRVMPLLLHGDTAFCGQGVVTETFQLSELEGYRTGGTIHVIVNNQIGFTTPPKESRSTPYATDVARMMAVPILHVNGEDARAVAAVVQLAVSWRSRFHRDVVIDMYCYRKHGHNEGDEPSFTQPLMYDAIRSRPTPREMYARSLLDKETRHITEEDVQRVIAESDAAMESQATMPSETSTATATLPRFELDGGEDPDLGLYTTSPAGKASNAAQRKDLPTMRSMWSAFLDADASEEADTRVDKATLQNLLRRANAVPAGFSPHVKVRRLLAQRLEVVEGTRPVDWAMAEQAAFATLVVRGHPVRISGQDCARGTFSQRHAVATDTKNGDEYFALQHLAPDQAAFAAIDSSLSEEAVLGFEVGYAMDMPEALVLWEAQFGDFVNGAQVIIDQFIAAAEQKWHRLSGVVLLLPHGHEGQGPEHSSARPERFLMACAEENMQVANCTTPANYFHLLRRQVLRGVRKPLVLFTPKSLLRHPQAVSTLEDLADGAFQKVIDEVDPIDPAEVRRVVFCSGKVYYDLLEARRAAEESRVAIARVELLYPFPKQQIEAVLARYPSDVEVVWAQEEPRNMGPWPALLHWFMEHFPNHPIPRYVGRAASAAPATGSNRVHHQQQQKLVGEAITLSNLSRKTSDA